MLKFFMMLSIFGGMLSYINLDPMKSCFFLIFSLLFSMPIMSFGYHIWFSYFICLLFLSGVFVILVYFSSLSKIGMTKSYLFFLVFFLMFFFNILNYNNNFFYLNLNGFYYSIYWFIFTFILFMLIFFMNFSSYYLNFSGALRKI